MTDAPTAAQLRTALADVDLPAPRGEIEEALADRDLVEDPVDTVAAAIDAGSLVEDGEGPFGPLYRVGDSNSDDGTPTPDGEETTEQNGENPREAAVDALRDVIRFYHDRVDDTIADHTETGDHPDRPTTAREYYTDVRGWDDATVDELHLGWAPPDHVDELVTHLHDRGHSREAMLATGAIGESDDGGLYTTFSARYVLPYYDANGEPAYAIARATGGEGGGGAGYGGHPADHKPGKYAKLRHTDEKVPFEEPIYGLGTLDDDPDKVVIAEGIADAITAREQGYAVLSPVAREFKKRHYDPLASILGDHGVRSVTIVGDADLHGSDDEQDHAPESIGEAVDRRLVDVPAGLSGALRTADELRDRREGLDVSVVTPPSIADVANDLDDWVTEWGGGLGVLLRAARPPEAFDAFDTVTASTAPSDEFEDFDAEAYDPDATASSETTDDIRDLFAAIDRLDAQRVADDTIVRTWLDNRGEKRTFAPTWAPAGYDGTANYVDHDKWVDTGDRGGYGGPVAMAAIDAGLVSDRHCPDAVEGETWFEAVDHLRDLGYDIPRLIRSDELDTDGDDLTDADVWAMWEDERLTGGLDETNEIPPAALRHIAREKTDLDVPNVDDLPPRIHNAALGWLEYDWLEENLVDDDDDADEYRATATGYKSATDGPVRTWDDVQYVYEKAEKRHGRKAARDLLSDRYDFATIAETETLLVYDPETGVFEEDLAPVRAEVYDGLGDHWSTHELNEIVAGLRQTNVIKPEHLNARDRDEPLLCVENGVLNLLTKELNDHSPEYHFTRRVPVTWVPDADTAPYREFVDSLVERDEDRQTLFEMVGHALMPDANERYKKFLILTGDADNGKSQFFARVRALLNGPDGEEGNTANVKLQKIAQNRFSFHAIHGTMANIAGEIDGKKIRNTATLKDIVGGDAVEIEPKGADSYFDTINSTLMFAANDPPIIGIRDKEAIASRIAPVELPYKFVDAPDGEYEKAREPERELEQRLETPEALSGFLKLAVEGIERLEENHGDVSLPEDEETRLKNYEQQADPMREFGEKMLTNDPDSYLVKADVTELYREWATRRGHELGSSVHRALHNALRGVNDLNYTESHPRDPDYSDTPLPLRGWDERKKVIDRCSLTDEGLDLADAAGLVIDEDDDPDTLADLDPQYDAEFEATAVTNSNGEYDRVAQGLLEGDHGKKIAYVIPGGNENLLGGMEGATVRLSNVMIRSSTDGLLEAVINDAVDLEELDDGDDTAEDSPDDDGGDDDGGDPLEAPVQPIEEIDPHRQLAASVQAEVRVEEHDGLSGDDHQPALTLTLDDGTGTAQLVMWDERDTPGKLFDGGALSVERVRVENAEVGEYDDEIQLTVTDRTAITVTDRPEESLSAAAESDDTAAATDGGEPTDDSLRDLEDAAKQAIVNRPNTDSLPRGELVRAVLSNTEADDPDRVNEAIDKALERGDLRETGDGLALT